MEEDALFKRGRSISANARHLDRDRKTIRSYLNAERVAGVRRSAAPDPLAPFVGYVKARFVPMVPRLSLASSMGPLGRQCDGTGSGVFCCWRWDGGGGWAGCQVRSEMATGSSQWGQVPPGPIRRHQVLQSGQRCWPRYRVSQLGHW